MACRRSACTKQIEEGKEGTGQPACVCVRYCFQKLKLFFLVAQPEYQTGTRAAASTFSGGEEW